MKPILFVLSLLVLSTARAQTADSSSEAFYAGTGILNNAVVTAMLPRSQVEAMLPAGLTLASDAEAGAPATKYPVIFFFGMQEKVGPNQTILPIGITYHEFILVVPYTHLAGSAQPLNYLARFFVDNTTAILLGKPYLYPKVPGRFEGSLSDYRITSSAGAAQFQGALTQSTAPVNAQSSAAFNKRMARVFTTPMVAVKDGKASCSQFKWDLEKGLVSPGKGSIRVLAPFATGLRTGQYTAPSLTQHEWGSFHIHARWHLSTPYVCRF